MYFWQNILESNATVAYFLEYPPRSNEGEVEVLKCRKFFEDSYLVSVKLLMINRLKIRRYYYCVVLTRKMVHLKRCIGRVLTRNYAIIVFEWRL